MFTKINGSSGQQWQGAEELLMLSRDKIAFNSWLHKARIKYVVKTQEDPQDSASSTVGVQHCLAETGYLYFLSTAERKTIEKSETVFISCIGSIKH